jgi:GT2 family glycosyltransferase
VIVLYNSVAELPERLRSIRPAVGSGSGGAILVDNDSPDDCATITRRELPNARVLTVAENLAFAAGVDAACLLGRYVLLNPDV